MPSNDTIDPREGWAHVGCPKCGYVTTVPLDRVEEPPHCIHVERVVWSLAKFSPEFVARAERMVRVTVTPALPGEQPSV